MSSLRINNNVPALNTHRNLLQNSQNLSKSLEKLSSGLRINRAADGPASLMISEQLRSQIANIHQATENAEVAVSMVQTTEAALSELTSTLTSLNRLAIHAANEGANSPETLEADYLEFTRALDAIDKISQFAQFGTRKLLDGSNAANGIAIGDDLDFVDAGETTKTSSVEGYAIRITQLSERASVEGSTALSQDIIDAGEKITLAEGGKTVTFITEKGDTASQVISKLNNVVIAAGLQAELTLTDDATLSVVHNEYGADHSLDFSSSTAGVISSEANTVERHAGIDIRGTFDGEVGIGEGQLLTGAEGTRAEDLTINYSGDLETSDSVDGEIAGRVALFQNSLNFQVGPTVGQKETISLVNASTLSLGSNIDNESGYRNLRDIDVRNLQGAEDAQRLLSQALNNINRNRAELGAFQKNSLETGIRQLRINAEELTNAESIIRDADMAQEITAFTRNNILVQSTTAMLAQANQAPEAVLSLLG